MAAKPSIRHIERDELYASLEARIRYLHSFLDFSSRDIEALTTGAKYIKALIPAIVNIVYKKLLNYDITARAFTTRSTSFNGPLDEVPTEDSPQIQHRKMFLRGYLTKLCSDPSKMEFWEYLDKVGMMHVGLGRTHPLHIEYIHLGVCLGFISDNFTEAILGHPKLPMSRKTALIKAINKVIWIQNDLMAKWHMEDGPEQDIQPEKVRVEPEGYLHGRKVLDEDDAVAAGQDSGGDGGLETTCPFASMAKTSEPVEEKMGNNSLHAEKSPTDDGGDGGAVGQAFKGPNACHCEDGRGCTKEQGNSCDSSLEF